MPCLLIRADADSQIGFGHVMRCIALGQSWRDQHGTVTFACCELPKTLFRRLENERFNIQSITSRAGSIEDAAELISMAHEINACALVLDGYQFDEAYQRFASNRQMVTLVLDDYGHLDTYHADFLLNQNMGVDPRLYEGRPYSPERLIGSRYALLRKEFFESARKTNPDQDELRLLVTLGGTDPGGVTQKVIDGLALLAKEKAFRVQLISNLADLQFDASQIDLVPFTDDMPNLYCWANLAICAGGSTNWEMSFFGIPRLIVTLADNQRGIAQALHRSGCALSVGWHEQLTASTLRDSLAGLLCSDLAAMRVANQQVIDGRGAERVAARLCQACTANAVRQNQVGRNQDDEREIQNHG